jgi:ABC-type polysaccharide/polyol phosphate export permease
MTVLNSIQTGTRRIPFTDVSGDVLRFALILVGGCLFSAHLRLRIAIGASLGEGYIAFPAVLLALILFSAGCAAIIRRALTMRRRKVADFLAALAGVVVVSVGTVLLLPDVSQLQVLYLTLGSAVIAATTLVLTPAKYPLWTSLLRLWQNRALLKLWVRYNVTSRYSQTVLGILWIVMLPVATSFILTFVFSFILKAGDIGNVPFISFFLSGLMFWALFTQGILNGSVSIVSNLSLINQIYFPREILVIVKLGEALVDLSFVFVVTLVINLFVGVFPNVNYIFLPLLLCIQLAFMLGIMFFTSYITVIIRDVQPLITVFLQLLFYLTPLMYPIDILSPDLAELVKFLNPVAALINAYRDIMVYNRPPDFESLYFAIVLSGVLLYSGYMFFKANERKLADFR